MANLIKKFKKHNKKKTKNRGGFQNFRNGNGCENRIQGIFF